MKAFAITGLKETGKVHRRVVDENAHEAEIRLDFLTPRCK